MGQDARTVLHPTRQEPSRKPRWHCQGCQALLRTVLAVLGFRRHYGHYGLRPPSPPSSPWPSPASPDLERAPPGSAVFPIKAGIPGWAQTKRDCAAQTKPQLSFPAPLGSEVPANHPAQAKPTWSPPGKKANQNESSSPSIPPRGPTSHLSRFGSVRSSLPTGPWAALNR